MVAMPRFCSSLAVLALSVLCVPSPADVTLPAVLSSHMVLQRDMPVPIWGQAAPGERVTVQFRGQTHSTQADAQGQWLVKLAPLAAGGPEQLVVKAANTSILEDVLVGEVWLGSGQSNMAGLVGSYQKNDPLLAKAAALSYPKIRLLKSGANGWEQATPENNARFSALLFAFGVVLHKEVEVPVGLMVGAVGGTPSGNWISPVAYQADKACQQVAAEFAKTYSLQQARQQYVKDVAAWEKAVAKAKQAGAREPRKPPEPRNPGECLRGEIGSLYQRHIRPFIPHAIRGVLWDQGESGTAIVGVDQFTLMGALIRGWRQDWGQGDFPFLYVQKPSGGGCAWDYRDAVTSQANKFEPLPATVPATPSGLFRELHIRIMQHPHTAMVSCSDLGPDTHPINKSGYGTRAARVALGAAYGWKIAIYGPTYRSHQVIGNTVRVQFSHVSQGLAYRHAEQLHGFALAGEDQVFHWADAQIEGDSVLVSCPKVPQPVAVRYAWGATHPWANLFNQDGLPALAFRTDTW